MKNSNKVQDDKIPNIFDMTNSKKNNKKSSKVKNKNTKKNVNDKKDDTSNDNSLKPKLTKKEKKRRKSLSHATGKEREELLLKTKDFFLTKDEKVEKDKILDQRRRAEIAIKAKETLRKDLLKQKRNTN